MNAKIWYKFHYEINNINDLKSICIYAYDVNTAINIFKTECITCTDNVSYMRISILHMPQRFDNVYIYSVLNN